jgi:hypothetical protein
MEGIFVKRPMEDPNHGTLAYFIIRYRFLCGGSKVLLDDM